MVTRIGTYTLYVRRVSENWIILASVAAHQAKRLGTAN